MVEAAIVLPIVILTAVLLLRLFVFYLEILTASVKAHEKALIASDNYTSKAITEYNSREYIDLIVGGLLPFDGRKTINVEMGLFNEDSIVRAKKNIFE